MGGFGTDERGDRDRDRDRDRVADRDRSVSVRRNITNPLYDYSFIISNSNLSFRVPSEGVDNLGSHIERQSMNTNTTNQMNVHPLELSIHGTTNNLPETLQKQIRVIEFPNVVIPEIMGSILYVQRAVDPLFTSRSI